MSTPPDPEFAAAEVGSARSLSASYPRPSGGGCGLLAATLPCFVVGLVLLGTGAETAGGVVVALALTWCMVGVGWMIASYVRRLRHQRRALQATTEGAALERARSVGNAAVARVVLPGVVVFVGCAFAGYLLHPAWWIAGAVVLAGTLAYGAHARSRAERRWNEARTDDASSEGSTGAGAESCAED